LQAPPDKRCEDADEGKRDAEPGDRVLQVVVRQGERGLSAARPTARIGARIRVDQKRRDAIEMVLSRAVFDGKRSWRMLATSANGQLAVGAYELDAAGVYAPHGVTVLTLEGDLIDEITHFRTPALVGRFGLPAQA